MTVPLYLVDAFTDVPFKGNPAGVCLLDEPAPESWMQDLAMEMNQAETAFLFPEEEGYRLRWFTPSSEVDLCGHATLASAHTLWSCGALAPQDAAVFNTKSGRLVCKRAGESITMDFPAEPPYTVDAPERFLEMFDAHVLWIGRNRMDYMVELANENEVRSVKPQLAEIAELGTRGVIFTAQAEGKDYDFVSRFFAPSVGVDEDPVTGSAHCCLGPYWAAKLGQNELVGYQASRRGGYVGVVSGGDRVTLKGKAVTVLSSEICLPSI